MGADARGTLSVEGRAGSTGTDIPQTQMQTQTRPRRPRNELAQGILENLERFPHCVLLTRVGQFYEVRPILPLSPSFPSLILSLSFHTIFNLILTSNPLIHYLTVLLPPSPRPLQAPQHQARAAHLGRAARVDVWVSIGTSG